MRLVGSVKRIVVILHVLEKQSFEQKNQLARFDYKWFHVIDL
jgi:hypothetical protein